MGAFIGYGDIGVWASNRERDAFLNWFAENRCSPGDSRWEYCKSEAQRWTGRCIDLEELLPQGEPLGLTPDEYSQAAVSYWPHVAQLLGIIETITSREWQIRADSRAAVYWRRDDLRRPEGNVPEPPEFTGSLERSSPRRTRPWQPMAIQAWTWNAQEHPDVVVALAAPGTDLDWCDRLETAPRDAVVGKMLCVCVAASIARRVLDDQGGHAPQAADALELLDRWIDEPTDERFDRICATIFEEGLPESTTNDVVWLALRTATSSVGNFEAGWALGSLCAAASEAGLAPEQLRAVVQQAVASRARPVDQASEDV